MAFSSSLPIACILTSSNKIVIPKSSVRTTSTRKLTFTSPCKPFPYAVPRKSKPSFPATPDNVNGESNAYTEKEWKIEREALLLQIETLELKVRKHTSESSYPTPLVDEILNDFHNISSRLQLLASSDDGLLIINPKPNPGPTSESVDEMVQNTYKYYDPAPGKKPKYLSGNFGPVTRETPPTNDITVVEGQIPKILNGMMLRNGPNPNFSPEGSYMWMDGDSMIHGIRFKDGKATYVARYTQTSRFIQQDIFKKAQILKYGDLVGEYGLFSTNVDILRTQLHILDKRFGVTTANTGLVYHGRRIMALEDFGEPHAIYVNEDGDLQTLGINNYNGKLDHWLSPHPKIDPVTGEMFNFGSLRTSPYCIYRVISKKGEISDPVPITVQVPTYMHELCITENYVIFQDLPLVYDPEKMKTVHDEWVFNFDDTKKPRYGILPRYATSEAEIKWFEFDDSFFVFHNANAWEEDDDTVVLYCCNMEAKEDSNTGKHYIAPINFQRFDGIGDFSVSIPQLFKMTFNMKTNEHKKERIVTDVYGDYPKINPSYTGRRTQYVYSGEVNDANKIPSIVKYDLTQKDGNPKRFIFRTDEFPHTYGSEVVFVPKPKTTLNSNEDDGYLLTFVHSEDSEDSTSGTSFVYVIDAKTMEMVAKLRLPARVPYGFHSIYVTEEELQNQIKPST